MGRVDPGQGPWNFGTETESRNDSGENARDGRRVWNSRAQSARDGEPMISGAGTRSASATRLGTSPGSSRGIWQSASGPLRPARTGRTPKPPINTKARASRDNASLQMDLTNDTPEAEGCARVGSARQHRPTVPARPHTAVPLLELRRTRALPPFQGAHELDTWHSKQQSQSAQPSPALARDRTSAQSARPRSLRPAPPPTPPVATWRYRRNRLDVLATPRRCSASSPPTPRLIGAESSPELFVGIEDVCLPPDRVGGSLWNTIENSAVWRCEGGEGGRSTSAGPDRVDLELSHAAADLCFSVPPWQLPLLRPATAPASANEFPAPTSSRIRPHPPTSECRSSTPAPTAPSTPPTACAADLQPDTNPMPVAPSKFSNPIPSAPPPKVERQDSTNRLVAGLSGLIGARPKPEEPTLEELQAGGPPDAQEAEWMFAVASERLLGTQENSLLTQTRDEAKRALLKMGHSPSHADAAVRATVAFAWHAACFHNMTLVVQIRESQHRHKLAQLRALAWVYLGLRKEVNKERRTAETHRERGLELAAEMQAEELKVQNLMERHARIVFDINTARLSPLWQASSSTSNGLMSELMNRSPDCITKTLEQRAWNWSKRSQHIRQVFRKECATMHISNGRDEVPEFRSIHKALLHNVRYVVGVGRDPRPPLPRKRSEATPALDVGDTLVGTVLNSVYRMLPSWIRCIAQVNQSHQRGIRQLNTMLEPVRECRKTVQSASVQLYLHVQEMRKHMDRRRDTMQQLRRHVHKAQEHHNKMVEAYLVLHEHLDKKMHEIAHSHTQNKSCSMYRNVMLEHMKAKTDTVAERMQDDEESGQSHVLEFEETREDETDDDQQGRQWIEQQTSRTLTPEVLAEEVVAHAPRVAATMLALVDPKLAADSCALFSSVRRTHVFEYVAPVSAARILERMSQPLVYEVLQHLSASVRRAVMMQVAEPVISLGGEDNPLQEETLRDVAQRASPELVAAMANRTAPEHVVALLWVPTALALQRTARDEPGLHASALEDVEFSAAIRAIADNALAGVCACLSPSPEEVTAMANLLGPDHTSRVYASMGAEESALQAAALPALLRSLVANNMARAFPAALVALLKCSKLGVAVDIASSLPMERVAEMVPALREAGLLINLLNALPVDTVDLLLTNLSLSSARDVVQELDLALAVQVLSLAPRGELLCLLDAKFLGKVLAVADAEQTRGVVGALEAAWKTAAHKFATVQVLVEAMGTMPQVVAGKLLQETSASLAREILQEVNVHLVAETFMHMPAQRVADVFSGRASSGASQMSSTLAGMWKGRRKGGGNPGVPFAARGAMLALAKDARINCADLDATWLQKMADVFQATPVIRQADMLQTATFELDKLYRVLKNVGSRCAAAVWDSLEATIALQLMRSMISFDVPWWAEVFDSLNTDVRTGLVEGLPPYQVAEMLQCYRMDRVADVLVAVSPRSTAMVYEMIDSIAGERMALDTLRVQHLANPQTAIAAMHHMTELTVQFLVSLIPHERVEILKAMHVNGVVDILGAMDLQVALNLCWELSSDHLAEISLRMEVHLLVKILDNLERDVVLSILGKLPGEKMGLVLRHMDGSYSTDLTLLLVSQGNLACTGSNPQLAQNSLDMMGTEGLLQYLSTSDVKFSAQVVLDLDLPFFKAGVEFMTPTLLAPILTRCCKDEIAQIAYWMSMVPAEEGAKSLWLMDIPELLSLLETMKPHVAANYISLQEPQQRAEVLNRLAPPRAGLIVSEMDREPRRSTLPFIIDEIRAYATSHQILACLNGPLRTTFDKMRSSFFMWARLLPLRRKADALMDQVDYSLVVLKRTTEPTSVDVATLTALTALTAYAPLVAQVLSRIQSSIRELFGESSTQFPQNAEVCAALWSACLEQLVLRPSKRDERSQVVGTTTYEKMNRLIHCVMANDINPELAEGFSLCRHILKSALQPGNLHSASRDCIRIRLWVRAILDMERERSTLP